MALSHLLPPLKRDNFMSEFNLFKKVEKIEFQEIMPQSKSECERASYSIKNIPTALESLC